MEIAVYNNESTTCNDAVDDLILDINRSRITAKQSRLDNDAGDSQGTRGMCGGSLPP
jgi:hypothetical protein